MKKQLLILALLLTASWLGGCMSMTGKPGVVIMQHPETMEFHNCEVSLYRLDKHYKENDECVEEYKRKGYVVWGKH